MKMKFGHHGANHPVQDLADGKVMITSQNHGFAVDESSLPEHIKATHRSLFDDSLQGIELNNAPHSASRATPKPAPAPTTSAASSTASSTAWTNAQAVETYRVRKA